MSTNTNLTYKYLHQADYQETYEAMFDYTLKRIEHKKSGLTPLADALWIVEHNDVYTLGQAGKESHILQRTNTPIIKTDRGGQVTWHGKGQLVVYWLFDLNALGWSVRNLVSHAEQAIEDVVNHYVMPHGYVARARKDAPGVYLYPQHSLPEESANSTQSMIGKIASLGFKIKHGMSYHGIALNVDCDLSAFHFINPCGYAGMTMCRLADFVALKSADDIQGVTERLIDNITQRHQGNIALR
ncbi:lipoyl(octanoyl) transferase LipB [Psychrobacter sp. I-STPA6b]|uniref:lipoyl(octanoyl) transferase LipB n=1 Tax=Psychrobacter sp. I-STPA6b TaxID=2585718 RepID=UPI001D0BFC83|nr:lipoyl(octanoyl) transferase LipB [Psychrobacter sp. I-STPA6b]